MDIVDISINLSGNLNKMHKKYQQSFFVIHKGNDTNHV